MCLMCSGLSVFSAKKSNSFTYLLYLQSDELTEAGLNKYLGILKEGSALRNRELNACLASSLSGRFPPVLYFQGWHAELVFTANTMLSPEQSIRDELHPWWAQMGEITVNPFPSALAVISWAKISPFTPRLTEKKKNVLRNILPKGTCTQGNQAFL